MISCFSFISLSISSSIYPFLHLIVYSFILASTLRAVKHAPPCIAITVSLTCEVILALFYIYTPFLIYILFKKMQSHTIVQIYPQLLHVRSQEQNARAITYHIQVELCELDFSESDQLAVVKIGECLFFHYIF